MKIGIMQPYFVPYIGYWQLMNAVDKYVIYDDVNFIKGGWINRNRILVNGEPKYFNIPMLGASPNKVIREVGVNSDKKLIQNNLLLIRRAYSAAPFYLDVFPIVEQILNCSKSNIADYIANSFDVLCEYMGITTERILSSTIQKDSSLRSQDKILEICRVLGATEYLNAIGGQELYCFEKFSERGIQLKFLQTNPIEYKQYNDSFQKNLSIIDVLMFNSRERVKQLLLNYTLIR